MARKRSLWPCLEEVQQLTDAVPLLTHTAWLEGLLQTQPGKVRSKNSFRGRIIQSVEGGEKPSHCLD